MENLEIYNVKDLISSLKGIKNTNDSISSICIEDYEKEEQRYPYYICILQLLEELSYYNFNILKLFKNYHIKYDKDLLNSNKYDTNYELCGILEENGILKEVGFGNSYNWDSPISHDFQYHTYYCEKNNMYYTLFSVHIAGDIRANYTDCVFLEFDYESQFLEKLAEVEKVNYIKIDNQDYCLTTNVLTEGVQVEKVDLETNDYEYLFYAYDMSEKEYLIAEIEEKLLNNA